MIDADINERVSVNWIKYLYRIIAGIISLMVIIFVVYALKLGLLDDKMVLVNYIGQYGILAPVIFIVLQLLQVIIPIIPGGVSCFAGVLAFGPVLGFIYNYIGMIIGSCIVYYLSSKYGLILIKKIFKEKTINKYLKYISNNTFEKLFMIGIVMPFFPDDLLCYIAGLSNLKFKRFLFIILHGRSISLLFYSLFIWVM